jgi:peptidyl-prolyl cis-trans isomerase D
VRADTIVRRNSATPERSVIEAAFKLPRPAEGKASAAEVPLANGDLAVILLRKVEEPVLETPASNETAQLREALAGAEYAAMRKSLEKDFKVEIKNPPADPAAPAGEPGN